MVLHFFADDKPQADWFGHWASSTVSAMEKIFACLPATGKFCLVDTFSIAEICLVGQRVSNKRFEVYESQQQKFNETHASADQSAFADQCRKTQQSNCFRTRHLVNHCRGAGHQQLSQTGRTQPS
jgi:hypothetical protein